jgi:hypothetical protein
MFRISSAAVFCALAAASQSPAQTNDLPLKHAPRATAAEISEKDLRTRLYIFADDSMQGRQFGREGNMKGTAYIASELKRLGIEPAGDNGTYFQALPITVRKYTDKSTLMVDGRALRWNEDFVAVPARSPRPLANAQVVFGGVSGDTINVITKEQAAGKIVLLAPAQRNAAPAFGGGGGGGFGGGAAAQFRNRQFADAAAVVTADLDDLSASQRAFINNPPGQLPLPEGQQVVQTPPSLRVTRAVAATMLGRALEGAMPGTLGASVSGSLDFSEVAHPEYGRNVVGVVRGSDPRLRGQYLMISAHNDHVGFTATPVDHDSLFALQHKALVMSFVGQDTIRALPLEQRRAIQVNVDSLRKLRPARLDSIRNGADDDGSGSMGLLEIAEAMSKMPTKPRRSILFMWHTGEEAGLQGARWHTTHFLVPKDSIVAALNMDMIGRGAATDIPGGSPDFLGVVGAGFISGDLGEAARSVNGKQPKPLKLDYRFDGDVTGSLGPAYNNIYRRSDHFMYAQAGIPIAFFFTGLHADYHQVTDEPQYIDYVHYNRITKYVRDLAVELANRDQRPAITKPTP